MWNPVIITFVAIAVMECSKAANVIIPETNSTKNIGKLSDPGRNGTINSIYRRQGIAYVFPNNKTGETITFEGDDAFKGELNNVSRPKRNSRNERKALELKNTYCNNFNFKRKNLTLLIHEKPYKIIVKSTKRAPSRAAAAIIATILKYGLGYNNVSLEIDNRNNCELATGLESSFENSDEIFIYVDADWKGPEDNCNFLSRCPHSWSRTCSIAGPRLMVIGATPGVNIRLHAVLRTVDNSTVCQNQYNLHNFKECGFIEKSESNSKGCIQVLIPPDIKVPVELNLTDIDGIPLCQYRRTNRSTLLQLLDKQQSFQGMDNNSFFFIDYDFYSDYEIVKKVYLPIRYISDVTALRVADYNPLRQFAPLIVDVLYKTTPNSTELREIVYLNAGFQDFEKATCVWANKHTDIFKKWDHTIDIEPWIAIFFCEDDPAYLDVRKISLNIVQNKFKDILKIYFSPLVKINCSDKYELNTRLTEGIMSGRWQWLTGVVASGEGVEVAIDTVTSKNLQMVVYNTPPTRLRLSDNVISSTGSLPLLARAIRRFFKQHGWRRIAIISDRTSLAEDLLEELDIERKIQRTIVYRNEYIEKENNITNIDEVLAKLKEADARIIFVNTEPDTANFIACKATELGMNLKSKYAWIAYEWQPAKCYSDLRIITISYGWRGQYPIPSDTGGDKTVYSEIKKGLYGQAWPPLAVSLVDAILLIAHRVKATVSERPYLLYDLHGDNVIGTMANITKINPGSGVIQSLELHDNTRANPLIYVNAWSGEKIIPLAIWKGISNSQEIIEVSRTTEMDTETIPKDGSSTSCMFPSGENYNPSCDDAKWICGFSALLLIFFALWIARRRQKQQIKKRERDTLMRLLTRCEKTASVLSSHLVERSYLDLQEELGYGHFGRVRFGLLRRPNRQPTPIAAKALRNDAAPAEEAEFLREASTLASLSHAHIIRFVGACADTDGPPLLLMEHAFFGDLLRYLRARRHLAEAKDEELYEVYADNSKRNSRCGEEEESYVTAVELTRLACEAALALVYLKERHILHRDVRAANCLVNAKRSLKLADFGMARRVGGDRQPDKLTEELETPSDYKYICRRKGVFPVPWMAPESIERGEFSHASDVWALGVLILEVATLGARPFGVWRPLTVLRFVSNGGRPPLPIDVSYYTTEVTEMCWADLHMRATAAEVYDYLRAHPTAIRAALRPAWPEPSNSPHGSDSGFGDTHADHVWVHNLRVSTL